MIHLEDLGVIRKLPKNNGRALSKIISYILPIMFHRIVEKESRVILILIYA